MQVVNELLPYYTYTDVSNNNSDKITAYYESVRQTILEYVGANEKLDTVIYTQNGTAAINILSIILRQQTDEDVVLTTCMEHMANYLPYKQRVQTILIGVDQDGSIDMEDYVDKLQQFSGKIKLVAVTGASNVTGVMPKIYDMAALAHQYGAPILVDGVQRIQHQPIKMMEFISR